MMTMLFPETIPQLTEYLRDMPRTGRIICGGTDLIITMRKQQPDIDCLLDVSRVSAMNRIDLSSGSLYLGGACTMQRIADSPDTQIFQGLVQAAAAIGSQQIRNKASIAGNIMNHSPAGDIAPVLLALEASIHTLSPDGTQAYIPTAEFLARVQEEQVAHTAVLGILFPKPGLPFCSAFAKLGDRKAVAISKINLAVKAELTSEGRMKNVRLALGAVGDTAFRSREAEHFLEGQPLAEELSQPLGNILSQEIQISISHRKSHLYKQEAVKGLTETLCQRLVTQLR